jgi:putative radical SAM enzyme (TIGR03279 family)
VVVSVVPGAVIALVETGSLAEQLGLVAGDRILTINQQSIEDLIQFQIAWADELVQLEILKKNGDLVFYELEKEYDEPLGAHFEEAVFNGIKTCRNKCAFCFVDQMPPKMRKSLYLKDDDYRLSFLQGSYITLTNLEREDLERIKRERLSPLYVSVHTTNPELRIKLMQNPRAGQVLDVLRELAAAGIEFHTQLVVCPEINDGAVLKQTYQDLSKIPGVLSLAVVPVGLTAFRQNLSPLRLFRPDEARRLVQWVEEQQAKELEQRGSRFLWPSDEFYLLAALPFPSYEAYEDFAQLENGVGMVRLLWDEFGTLSLPDKLAHSREIVIATGVAGLAVMEPIVERLNGISGLKVSLQGIRNSFFGPSVTVAGLLTGSCFLEGLKGLPPGSAVLIPDSTVQSGNGRFLDDLTPAEVGKQLGIRLLTVPVSAEGIWSRISGIIRNSEGTEK